MYIVQNSFVRDQVMKSGTFQSNKSSNEKRYVFVYLFHFTQIIIPQGEILLHVDSILILIRTKDSFRFEFSFLLTTNLQVFPCSSFTTKHDMSLPIPLRRSDVIVERLGKISVVFLARMRDDELCQKINRTKNSTVAKSFITEQSIFSSVEIYFCHRYGSIWNHSILLFMRNKYYFITNISMLKVLERINYRRNEIFYQLRRIENMFVLPNGMILI